MEYTEAMLWCLRKMSEDQLEELKNEWERKYVGSQTLEYLIWLICRAEEVDNRPDRNLS